MQVTKNNQSEINIDEFTKDGILLLEGHSRDAEDIAYTIEKLETVQACERIHTIHTVHISMRVLFECGDLWDALKAFMNKSDKIVHLSLHHRYMDATSRYNIDTIIEILCEFKNITSLELILVHIVYNADEMHKLKQYFDSFIAIKNLRLESDYRTILCIMEAIESCTSIETIDVSLVNIKDVTGLIPASLTHKIKKIHFSDCHLYPDHMEEFNAFFECFLALNPTICELSLRYVSINADTVVIISDFIKTRDNLTTLSVRGCDVNGEKIDILARALEMSNVEKLDIHYNNIGCEGVQSIAAMLKANESLKVLNIGYNLITYGGIIEILKVLAINSRVSEFCCTSTISVIGETIESVQQTFEQILLNNYVLVHFVVWVQLVLHGRNNEVRIELENITKRNKEMNDELRFVRVKPMNS